MVSGHEIKTTTEQINGETYQVDFLQEKENFLSVNDVPFHSFEDAINYIEENLSKTGTIKFTSGTEVSETVTIPAGFTITIDLNGKTELFTQPIVNNGALTMTDGTSLKDGTINNSKTTLFSAGTDSSLTIESGTYTTTKGYGVSLKNGVSTFNMTGGSITSSNHGIYAYQDNGAKDLTVIVTGGNIISTNESGVYLRGYNTSNTSEYITFELDGGYITGAQRGIYVDGFTTINIKSGTVESTNTNESDPEYSTIRMTNYTKLNMTGGTIKNAHNYAVRAHSYNSNVEITGGKFETQNGFYSNYDYGSTYNISNLEMDLTGTYGIYNEDGRSRTHTLKNSTIKGATYGIYLKSGYYNNGSTNWNIENTIIEAATDGIMLDNYNADRQYPINVTFKSGTITAGRYGVNINNTQGSFTSGDNSESVNYTKPVIQGEEYGIYAPVGNLNYFDGNSRGLTGGIKGDFNTLPDGYEVRENNELVGEKTYVSAKLYEMTEIAENKETGTKYINLQTAIDEVGINQTIRLIDNATVTYALTVPATANFILDLNGFDLTTTKAFTNNGILSIIDGTNNKKTLQNIKSMYIITNTKTLNVTGIKLKGYKGIDNSVASSVANITNVEMTTSNQGFNNVGTLTIDHLTATIGGGYGIYNNTTMPITITDSTINCSSDSIYNYANSSITITNSTVTGQVFYNRSTGIIEYEGGSFTGRLYTEGKTTLDGLTISYSLGDVNISDNNMIEATNELIIKNSTLTYTRTQNNNWNRNYYIVTTSGEFTSENNIYTFNDNSAYRAGANRIINTTGSANSTSTNDIMTMNNTCTRYDSINNSYARLIYHSSTGTFDIDDIKMTITNGEEDIAIITAANAGDMTLRNADITAAGRLITYAINPKSKVVFESGTIKASAPKSYGVYIESTGSFTSGVEDGTGTDSAVVSVTDPYIISKGTTFGYGVKNAEGIFNYYDGKIAGSTNALVETPTKTELNYSPITFFDGTDKVEYVQLTYIKNWDGYVAETNGKLFADLQSALSYASSGSKVKLLKDTNEFVTNNAENVTLDLNGNKLNGKIINKGKLNIVNGTIENIAGSAIDNEGILEIGDYAKLGDPLNPIFIGTTSCINNSSDLYFYSGTLKANTDVIVNTGNIYPLATFKIEAGTEDGYITNYLVDDNEYVPTNVYNYSYTGKEDFFLVPVTGDYTIEAWGAQGGQSYGNGAYREVGGYGAYSTGKIHLEKRQILYINIGGQGEQAMYNVDAKGGYNGGGNAAHDHSNEGSNGESAGGGGGASHIAFTSGLLSELESKKDQVIMVAAGGGGSAWYMGGHAGGIESKSTSYTPTNVATQTSGYAFGIGQSAGTYTSSTKSYDGVAGAGGGWYGGYTQDVNGRASGIGGSSYIGYANLTDKAMYCYNCTTSDEESTKTITVNTSSADPISNKPKQGNGYVSIKLEANIDNLVVGT